MTRQSEFAVWFHRRTGLYLVAVLSDLPAMALSDYDKVWDWLMDLYADWCIATGNRPDVGGSIPVWISGAMPKEETYPFEIEDSPLPHSPHPQPTDD